MSGEGGAPPPAPPADPPAAPVGTAPGHGLAAGADPSMDDILASIRRILNEDEEPPRPGAPPGTPSDLSPAAAAGAGPDAPLADPAAEPPAEPFDLTEAMLVDASPGAASPPAAPPPSPPRPATAPPPVGDPPMPAPVPDDHPAPAAGGEAPGLIGAAAAAAAATSMGALVRAVSAERGMAVARGSGPTLEDLVRDEMRPILRAWLDEHLPPLVERLVRAEIERVVGRALG